MPGGGLPGGPSGVGEQHRRQQAQHLGVIGAQSGRQPGQPDCFVAQLIPDHPRAGAGPVSLGEHQVDNAEDTANPVRQLVVGRHPERYRGVADLPLGPHQPLRHCRFGHQKCARNLIRLKAAQGAKRKRDLRFQGKSRVTAGENKAKAIVRDFRVVIVRLLNGPAQLGAV